MAELNIGYEALVSCHDKLVSEIAKDPKQMAVSLFQHRFIFEDTKAKINELDRIKRDKAILLVDDIESKVKCYPEFYEKFLLILGENELLYCDLVKSLQEEYEKIKAKSKDVAARYENGQLSLLQPIPMSSWVDMTDETDSVFELPTVDDGGTLPDPLVHPPDVTEVGADLRAAATSRQEAPIVGTFEGRLLQAFQSGEFEKTIELLSQAESQSIDLRGVSDADGKTLLHLACRKNWVDWHGIVRSLVEKHHCDVAAVDEDWNTPLHEAYQCGNLPIVAYLLTLPSCNPDAINKHEYTVLRMALETTDKPVVRDLLATGRVDPRKGSPRGHTYSELLAMNQLQPQDYDGSALQMVTQFAECMEGNNHVRQPFTSYCLLRVLHKVLKNRPQLSITGIVDRIKENMLPLPEKPDEIHDLLIDIQRLSNEFYICGEPTNVADIQIRKKEDTSGTEFCQHDIQLESSTRNAPQNVTVPAEIDDQEILDYSNASDVLPILQPSHTEESMVNTSHDRDFVIAADNEDQETPNYYSKESDELPILQPSHEEEQKTTQNNEDFEKVSCCSCFCCCFCVFLLLGVCGAVFYDGYSLVGTTSVVQIHRESVPLIAKHDPSTQYRLSEVIETDLVPISFYTLSDCFSDDSFIDVEINEIVTVNFDSPTDYGKAVTQLYLLGNTTIRIDITTEVLPQHSPDSCLAAFVIFNDLNNYLNFLSSSFLPSSYYYLECITNEQSQTRILTFNITSYYYIGVYTDIPTEVAAYTLHFVGTYLQYDILKGNAICFISSRDALSCDFSTNQPVCIVGSVQPDLLSGIRLASVEYYTAAYSNTVVNTFFFTPLMCSIFLVCVVSCLYVIILLCRPDKRQEAQIT